MQVVTFKPSGIVNYRKLKIATNNTKNEVSKRGKIMGFSCHSRGRLRSVLIDNTCNLQQYSLTLTVPGDIDPDYSRLAFQRFTKMFKSVNAALIWRKEVQARAAEHWHCLLWAEYPYDIVAYWQKAIWSRMQCKGAYLYSVKLDKITDCSLWSRYMQEHMSKEKISQIAQTGRQWGIINRKLLSPVQIEASFNLTKKQWDEYRRVQRNIFRKFKKNPSSCFQYSQGFQSHRGVIGKSVWFSEESKKQALKGFLETQKISD